MTQPKKIKALYKGILIKRVYSIGVKWGYFYVPGSSFQSPDGDQRIAEEIVCEGTGN